MNETTVQRRATGAVTGGVRTLLRLEGLTLFRGHDAALRGLGRLLVGLSRCCSWCPI